MSIRRSWERDIADSEMGPLANRGASRVAHVMLLSIFTFFVCFIIWAYNAELDEVTRGEGKIIPTGQTKIVQHLEGGIISNILISEGMVVEQGQVLLRIENKVAEAALGEKRKQYLNLTAQAARLVAEINGNNNIQFPDEVRVNAPEIARQEELLFQARRSQQENQLSLLRNQVEQKDQELKEIDNKFTQLQKTRKVTQEEYDLVKPLVDVGASPRLDLLRVQQKLAEIDQEIDANRGAIPRIQTQKREAEERIGEKELTFQTEAQEQLNLVQVDAARLLEDISAGVDRAVRTDVRSPVHGVVKQVLKNTIGGVVGPGDDLVEIVPLEDTLLVEARIQPSDRAQLWPGLPAVVKVSAYDFSIHGGLDATLTDISPDTITDEQGETYYRIRLRTDQNNLGEDKPIRTGMTTTVDILTGRKTVLDYLLKPILKAKENALRER
ncbi:HlyD family type I secretion periplasmic adaptor subunit [Curvivirga aplysinae]|uniref:HlyD family type I secretion periplasmic adaptor subunit n=1 Tax=Curvivirga aplysinae TaxID=2529852 RepID=UPI0012BBCBD7|nr:HlyD family type I secretion periplasmic adaptor subunit [Curvivirga aplysinae]MTI10963.1 HlyD family type I secretion periplasmic adaptor subunit [Curvivirga aplysinae]